MAIEYANLQSTLNNRGSKLSETAFLIAISLICSHVRQLLIAISIAAYPDRKLSSDCESSTFTSSDFLYCSFLYGFHTVTWPRVWLDSTPSHGRGYGWIPHVTWPRVWLDSTPSHGRGYSWFPHRHTAADMVGFHTVTRPRVWLDSTPSQGRGMVQYSPSIVNWRLIT